MASKYSNGPQLTRATPSSASSARGRQRRQPQQVHRAAGLRHEAAERSRLPQADRVDAVRAGLEVGIRALQRLRDQPGLDLGIRAGEHGTEEDVDPRVDDERVVVVRRGLAHRPEPLGLPVGVMEGAVVAVLEVAAGGPGAPQRRHQLGGLHPVAGLGVDGHGHVDPVGDPRGRGEHLVRRRVVVLIAEGRRHRRAAGRDDGEPGRDHRPRRGHVPGVREQERRAGAVQGPQQIAPALEIGDL